MTMYRRVIAPLIACTLLAFLAYLVYQLAQPFLAAIGVGVVLTVITFPLYERLRRKLGGRDGAAAALMVLLVLLLLVVPAVGLIGALGQQATDVYRWLEKAAGQDNPVQRTLDRTRRVPGPPVSRPGGRVDPPAARGVRRGREAHGARGDEEGDRHRHGDAHLAPGERADVSPQPDPRAGGDGHFLRPGGVPARGGGRAGSAPPRADPGAVRSPRGWSRKPW